jgi:ethanolamine ammonia-lyase small subunit
MSAADDPWRALRRHTPARIGLGRAGVSLPTARALELQAAHAAARTAVHAALDAQATAARLGGGFSGALTARSQAADRATYLQRPDLGRRLNPQDRPALEALRDGADIAVVVADGLSALAVERHAGRFLDAFLGHAARHGWRLAPLVVAAQARVALGDAVAAALGARLAMVLIGERPGLSSPDSLGLYLTWAPQPGVTTDAERNCVSNIRDEGLDHALAAHRAAHLVEAALARGLTGVALKDETAPDAVAPAAAGGRVGRADDAPR